MASVQFAHPAAQAGETMGGWGAAEMGSEREHGPWGQRPGTLSWPGRQGDRVAPEAHQSGLSGGSLFPWFFFFLTHFFVFVFKGKKSLIISRASPTL